MDANSLCLYMSSSAIHIMPLDHTFNMIVGFTDHYFVFFIPKVPMGYIPLVYTVFALCTCFWCSAGGWINWFADIWLGFLKRCCQWKHFKGSWT